MLLLADWCHPPDWLVGRAVLLAPLCKTFVFRHLQCCENNAQILAVRFLAGARIGGAITLHPKCMDKA